MSCGMVFAMASIFVQISDGENQIQYQGLATDGMLVFCRQQRRYLVISPDHLLLKITGLGLQLPDFCSLDTGTGSFWGFLIKGNYILSMPMSTWDMIATPIKLSFSLGQRHMCYDLVGGDTRPTSPIDPLADPADPANQQLKLSYRHADGSISIFCGIVHRNGHVYMDQEKVTPAEAVVYGEDKLYFQVRYRGIETPLEPLSVRLTYRDVCASASTEGFISQPRPETAVLTWVCTATMRIRTWFVHFPSFEIGVPGYRPSEALPPLKHLLADVEAQKTVSSRAVATVIG